MSAVLCLGWSYYEVQYDPWALKGLRLFQQQIHLLGGLGESYAEVCVFMFLIREIKCTPLFLARWFLFFRAILLPKEK